MSLPCALETIAIVAALLSPDQARAPREIWSQLPHTSPASVRGALWVLMQSGRVAFEGEMGRRRYRLNGEVT